MEDDLSYVQDQFNSIRWHDTKLLGFRVERVSDHDEVELTIRQMAGRPAASTFKLRFEECTFLTVEIDIEGKRLCADDISGAQCHRSSNWIHTLSEIHPHDNFQGWLHFEIGLIPPGGTLNFLAKGFSVSQALT